MFECTQVLNLGNMIAERRIGLHSVLTVLCKSCDKSTIVHTGKMMENNVSHINMAVILGAVHAGTGNTALNKILACSNVPSIFSDLYKRYEKMVGEAIEKEAKASCKRAAILERDLVIKNIEKLNDEL
ncbi:uncharacterized protein LOC143906481 [Temnothorax americanus]|uniref:uncharacterized protein LOC143905950 n=1 Tax=Temnothorax americanus TaxID=1964332 RepID=UPI0040683434